MNIYALLSTTNIFLVLNVIDLSDGAPLILLGKSLTTISIQFTALKMGEHKTILLKCRPIAWVVSCQKSVLVQEMAWRQFGAKPFLEARLT